MATLEAKNTSSQSLEEKQRTGTMKSTSTGFGRGTFGTARFDEKSGYESDKEAKQASGRSLEAKP